MVVDDGERMRLVRLFALIAACALLNIGLYYILWFLTPFVAGAATGYLLAKRFDAIAGSAGGSLLAYLPLFMYTSGLDGLTVDFAAILVAALMMAAIAVIGGLLGNAIQKRTIMPKNVN
ncbi:hypothetical protein EU545_03480 [Candidatus Thorarchaeota archaeon]|nr:MAG: hypothetical protein EU545_03480 [Candidatus Thorarchaeota archaeon]